MRLSFGIDIGVASVGWAVVNEENGDILESGANLFESADAAKNKERRGNRQGKRLRRRRRNRVADFVKLWQAFGFLMPSEMEANPVELRVKGLISALTMDELFCVLQYMLKHRGISYLEDAEIEPGQESTYGSSLGLNQKLLGEKHPCEIQWDRLCRYGEFRGQFMVEENGESITLCNVFTISAYRKELKALFAKQCETNKLLNREFIRLYMTIFDRKREYYIGPGNEASRTDYGVYTTEIDVNGDYITEKNLFSKLIGKCSVYPEEERAAGASYTAQEYNVLSDLNNLKINGRKLSECEKRNIIALIKTSKTVNMHRLIAKCIEEGVIDSLEGARINKEGKEIFHHFETYNKMRNILEKIGVDITSFTRDELDQAARVLTLNTERDSIVAGLGDLGFTAIVIDTLVNFRRNNGNLFNKWASFSVKAMEELIPVMYETSKGQQEILTEMNVFKSKREVFKNYKYIPEEVFSEAVYNPVVVRSARITVRVINALLKKYGSPSKVVIEMPRDRNEDEEKERIKKEQKDNETELKGIIERVKKEYGVEIRDDMFYKQKGLVLKLKLWNEQNGRCPYSGRTISVEDLINHPNLFEVDHIIPLSISFNDSRTNKTLVYRTENYEKGAKTPWGYLSTLTREWGWDQYKAYVIDLKKANRISSRKLQNYLFMEDITKIQVVKGFINRNLNDTRYASKIVLNTISDFFAAKEANTVVKVIRGSFTSMMRKDLNISKDRDESFSHHAVDAMLLCFSQMGYDSFRKLQGSFIDFETGELLDPAMFAEKMTDDVYKKYLYGMKWGENKRKIVEAEKKVKYWHAVDHKCNRGLCDQTIYGTREVDGTIYKVSKTKDIRTKAGFEKLKKKISENKQEQFLMYRNDRKTFDILVQIMKDYCDASNPFVQYEAETKDIVRKYSKKNNGPKITKLAYLDEEVNSCIDISHKYGYEKGTKHVVLMSLVPYRMDVYYHSPSERYYFVGVKQSDVKFEGGISVIDMEAYTKTLIQEKMLSEGQTYEDLFDLGYSFRMSFYKNDIIQYEKNGVVCTERFLSRTKPKDRNYIETKPIHKPSFDKQHLVGLSNTSMVKKGIVSLLGEIHYITKEPFKKKC